MLTMHRFIGTPAPLIEPLVGSQQGAGEASEGVDEGGGDFSEGVPAAHLAAMLGHVSRLAGRLVSANSNAPGVHLFN
jgi:hypothetical protein